MKNKIRNIALGAVVAFGFTGIGQVATAAPAEAYTTYVNWTKRCVGPNLWSFKMTTVDYSFWEEITWPFPKDYTTYTPVSLMVYNAYQCRGATYA